MGTEAAWVPLVVSAVGAAASAVAQNQQAKKQEDIANQMIRDQGRHQQEADSILNQNLDALGKSNGEAERQASLDAFLSQLRQNASAQGGTTGVPGASDRFKSDAVTGSAAIKNFGTARADILSRILGPTLQRMHEQQMTNRAGSEVTGTARDASGDAWVQQLAMQRNTLNPWLGAAGQFAQGAASGMASGWGAGTPGSATVSPSNPGRFGMVMDAPIKPRVPVGNPRAFA